MTERNEDKLPAAMVENTSEYEWAELPEWLKEKFREVGREFTDWAENEQGPIKGELANEVEA